MSDSLRAFLQATAIMSPTFPPDSRYHGLEVAQWTRPDGTRVSFVRRRVVPPPEALATARTHVVAEGDRVDNLAATHLGDPQQYWRLADGNGVIRPTELTDTVGRRLRVTLPEGVPGVTRD